MKRLSCFWLLLGASAQAQMDAGQIASSAGTAGMMMASMSGMNLKESAAHCACLGSTAGTCKSVTPAGDCAFLALNAAAMVGAIAGPFLSSQKTKSAVNTGDLGNFDFPPLDTNIPISQQMGCKDPASCGCSGPEAVGNPVCDPQAFKNLPTQLSNARALMEQGKVDLQGKPLDESLAELDKAQAQLAALQNGTLHPGDLGSGGLASLGDDAKAKGRGLGGMDGSAYGDGSDGAGLDLGGSSTKRAGPIDGTGLGKTVWNGTLDMVDEQSGKSLTLWQRATRRYQGDAQGRRAFAFARIEYLRKQALHWLKVASEKAAKRQAKVSAAAASKRRAPASTRPKKFVKP